MKMKTARAAVLLLLFSSLVVVAEDIQTKFHYGHLSELLLKELREVREQIHEQGQDMEAMRTRLAASEKKAETLETRLRASEKTVGELQTQAINGRVAFSASLLASGRGDFGPFSAETPLIYKHVITNVGNAYNPQTGVFTAPVRGVYYFRMVAYGRGDRSTATGTVLRKNGQNVVIAWISPPNSDRSMSNGASLQLEVGDKVSVNLWAKAWVYDNEAHYTTFSGHLLFPM